MASLKQVKMERARAFILAHPEMSKLEQAAGASVSTTLIGLARAELIDEGKLPASRKAIPSWRSDETPRPPKPALAEDVAHDRGLDPITGMPIAPDPTDAASLLDHAAMTAMAQAVDVDVDDAEIHRLLLRQARVFALDPRLHPDTRMSASQLWVKLRDQAKARGLGPGPPMTFEIAVSRMSDMMIACGLKIVLAALKKAFKTVFSEEASDEGQVPADANPAAPGDVGLPPAP